MREGLLLVKTPTMGRIYKYAESSARDSAIREEKHQQWGGGVRLLLVKTPTMGKSQNDERKGYEKEELNSFVIFFCW